MKSYMLYLVIIIIIVLAEKRQVTGNQLCEKCGENTIVVRRTKCECLDKYHRAIGKENEDKADCFRK